MVDTSSSSRQDNGVLVNDITPDGELEGDLEMWGLAVSGQRSDL
jgi:hypothetical protein